MASLRGLGGFEVTSTEIVLDRARRRSAALRIFFDTDKWIKFTITNFTPRQCIYLDIFNQNDHCAFISLQSRTQLLAEIGNILCKKITLTIMCRQL